MRKILILILAMFATIVSIKAEEKKEQVGDTTLTLSVANTYMWRGIDIHAGKFKEADKKNEGSFNMAPALMPQLTIAGPIAGLTFDIWMSWAPLNREDDKGALRKKDEVDYAAYYEFANKAGSWKAGYVAYAFPSDKDAKVWQELLFSYTLPIDAISITVSDYIGIVNTLDPYSYYSLAFSKSLELSKGMSIEPTLTLGLWAVAAPKTYKDLDASTAYFHLDVNVPFSYSISEKMALSINPGMSYKVFSEKKTDDVTDTDPSDGTNQVDKQALKFFVTVGLAYTF